MVQTLARCRNCGLPRSLAENFMWQSDGTLHLKRVKGVRLAIVDEGFVDGLFERMAGEECPEVLCALEQAATRQVVGRLTSGLKGKMTRYSLLKRRALEGMVDYSLLMGQGRIELERYTPAVEGRFTMKSPFNLAVIQSGIAGVLEQLDRRFYARHLTEIGKEYYRLIVEASDREAYEGEIDEPLALDYGEQRGVIEDIGCEQCGLPVALTDFIWDELHGAIYEGKIRRRVAMLPWYMVSALKWLIPGGEGGRLESVVEDEARAAMVRRLSSQAADTGEAGTGEDDSLTGILGFFLRRLQARGWGRAGDLKEEDGALRVSITNPVDTPFLTGCVRGIQSFALKTEAGLSVEEAAGSATFLLE